ncbi:MAG: hypothetical protein AAF713_07730 [Pseudomonadota bacterium]
MTTLLKALHVYVAPFLTGVFALGLFFAPDLKALIVVGTALMLCVTVSLPAMGVRVENLDL